MDGPLAGLGAPYVLLEDRLSPEAPARLYRDPVDVIRCDHPGDIDEALAGIERGLANGLHAAGVLSYELGYALEPRLAPLMPTHRREPLLWFGLFAAPERVAPRDLDAAFASLGPPLPISDLHAGHSECDHAGKVRQALELIAAGDLYQANLTFPILFRYAGDPLALYAALRTRQPVAHGGFVQLGDSSILSVSPELWLDVSAGRATMRPMKGTAPRGLDPSADDLAKRSLLADPKQRAENLMIVDLLRNDLARISQPSTVSVPELFTVETYPSFHTLTSTVVSELRPSLDLKSKLAALFPCGSIVGAPKIRAGEVIRALEATPRGVYTGAMGRIAPDGEMRFNVAIRTAVIDRDGAGRYGVGGGVVADSNPHAEYAEALLKARVLTELADDFGLIETFRWSATDGFVRLALHLERLAVSGKALGFGLDRSAIDRRLEALERKFDHTTDRRVRLVLQRSGEFTLSSEPLSPPVSWSLRVGVSEFRVDAGDPYLRHKTSRRALYDTEFQRAAADGLDEVLFLNQRDELTEASRNTLFAEIDGRIVTPALSCGLLPGVFRRAALESGMAAEAVLTLRDLGRASELFLGNSLHGLRRISQTSVGAASMHHLRLDRGARP
jgi:para-aminobenzoate synthetase/4-amino-4-deoxychorismate lyase